MISIFKIGNRIKDFGKKNPTKNTGKKIPKITFYVYLYFDDNYQII